MSADKLRVTIFLSGDSSNGKILSITDDLSFADLLTQATAKLESRQKLTRAFIYNGSEITDALDVIDGDRLYFTAGEIPVNCFEKPSGFSRAGRRGGPVRVASDSTSSKAEADKAAAEKLAAEQKAAQSKGFFSTILGAAVNTTAYVVDSSVTLVKAHTPAFVGSAIDTVESGVKTTADVTGVTFVAKQAGKVTGAVLDAADATVDAVYGKVKAAADTTPTAGAAPASK